MVARVKLSDLPKAFRAKVPKGTRLSKATKAAAKAIRDEQQTRTRDAFLRVLDSAKLAHPVAEHRFHPDRKWRFDYAWPAAKVALEVEGGVWIQGRHSRGAGMIADMQKYNTAAAMGWRVLRVTPEQLTSRMTEELLRRMLK